LPNLSAEKKSGKAALNTFAELAAFFKKEEPRPEPVPDVKKLAENKVETPPEVMKAQSEPKVEPVTHATQPETPNPASEVQVEPKTEETKTSTDQPLT
jgi:hypothetical protein